MQISISIFLIQSPSQIQDIEETRLAVSHTLQSCLQSDGRRRYATPPQQIAAFNRRSSPELIGSSGGEWIKPESDVVVGNDVCNFNLFNKLFSMFVIDFRNRPSSRIQYTFSFSKRRFKYTSWPKWNNYRRVDRFRINLVESFRNAFQHLPKRFKILQSCLINTRRFQ